MPTYIHTLNPEDSQKHTHTYIHTYKHTHIHTYTHTLYPEDSSFSFFDPSSDSSECLTIPPFLLRAFKILLPSVCMYVYMYDSSECLTIPPFLLRAFEIFLPSVFMYVCMYACNYKHASYA